MQCFYVFSGAFVLTLGKEGWPPDSYHTELTSVGQLFASFSGLFGIPGPPRSHFWGLGWFLSVLLGLLWCCFDVVGSPWPSFIGFLTSVGLYVHPFSHIVPWGLCAFAESVQAWPFGVLPRHFAANAGVIGAPFIMTILPFGLWCPSSGG